MYGLQLDGDTTWGGGYFTTNLMEWLHGMVKKNNKWKYIKHNGLIQGIMQANDMNEHIYWLTHLSNSKIGNKYVGVFTWEQLQNTALCLNCNKKGHFITDDNITIDDETYTTEALKGCQTDLSTANATSSMDPFTQINLLRLVGSFANICKHIY